MLLHLSLLRHMSGCPNTQAPPCFFDLTTDFYILFLNTITQQGLVWQCLSAQTHSDSTWVIFCCLCYTVLIFFSLLSVKYLVHCFFFLFFTYLVLISSPASKMFGLLVLPLNGHAQIKNIAHLLHLSATLF